MSSSTRNDRCFVMCIYEAPPHVLETEFRNSMEAFVAAWIALPVVKDKALKCDVMFANEVLDAHTKEAGLADRRPTAVVTGEYETWDDLIAMFTDNEMQQLVAVVDEFKPEREPCVFMADVTTKIERHDLSPKDKIDTVAVFKVPHHLHPDQYGQKLKALVHRAVALPSGQTAFLKLTVWGQNSNGNPHIKAWGVSPPEGIFVLRAECKNLETFMDVVNDPGFQQILAEVKKELDFHVKGAWFCTDVVTRLERS